MRQFLFDVYCFFDFLTRFFFLNGFPSPSIVHSLPSFLFEQNLHFSLMVFFVHMRHFDIDFLFFFWIWFFRNGFPKSLTVRSKSSVLFSQWKFFELYVRTCPAMFFLLRLTDFVSSYPDFLEFTFSTTYLTQKIDFWTHLWNFKFYEHLLIKSQ